MPQSQATARAYFLLTVTTVSWAANTIFGRLAVGQVSPMMLVTLRWLLVSILLALFAHRSARADWALMRPRLPFICALGTIGFTIFNALYYSAAHYTTAVNMGIVQGALPVFVVLGAVVVDRTRIGPARAVGVIISLLGVALVALGGDPTQLRSLSINSGDLLMIGACALYAAYTIALRRAPEVSPWSLLTVMAVAALVASLPLTAVEYATGNLQWPTPLAWLLISAIAMFPSVLSQAWFIYSVRLIGPDRAGMFLNLVPVFSAIMGVTLLSEPFETFHAVALGLVLGGIWLSERRA